MSKPWSRLISRREGTISDGEWFASCQGTHNASVQITFEGDGAAELNIGGYWFDAAGFRELAEFCAAVADQLSAEQPQ